MATDQMAVSDAQPAARQRDSVRLARSPRKMRWGWTAVIIVIFAVGGAGGAWFVAQGNKHPEGADQKRVGDEGAGKSHQARVQVIKPERGGMERVTSQPGTIRAFEFAPLFTKVSGFVKTLNVDRGSRVKKGELLAEIYDPERDVAVIQGQASLDHSKAMVEQAEASILTAQAFVEAAKAKQHEAKATYDQMVATRDYRKKEYQRISELVARGSVEEKVKDEKLDEYHASEAARPVRGSGHRNRRGPVGRGQGQGRAGQGRQEGGRSPGRGCRRPTSRWRKSSSSTHTYCPPTTVSSFTAVSLCTRVLSFVRQTKAARTLCSPSPMVAKMRTIVPIPDREVPYCNVGDSATVIIDALGSRSFQG